MNANSEQDDASQVPLHGVITISGTSRFLKRKILKAMTTLGICGSIRKDGADHITIECWGYHSPFIKLYSLILAHTSKIRGLECGMKNLDGSVPPTFTGCRILQSGSFATPPSSFSLASSGAENFGAGGDDVSSLTSIVSAAADNPVETVTAAAQVIAEAAAQHFAGINITRPLPIRVYVSVASRTEATTVEMPQNASSWAAIEQELGCPVKRVYQNRPSGLKVLMKNACMARDNDELTVEV